MKNSEGFLKQLNKLKNIEPDPGFVRASRTLILVSEAKRPIWAYFGQPALKFGGVAFFVLVFVAVAVFSPFGSKPALSASFNPNYLAKEFKNLTINIQLDEIEYREKSNRAIVSALNEIENTSISHLNISLLKSEEESFNLQESTNPEIDELLEKVIF